jgi:hypothetical protein
MDQRALNRATLARQLLLQRTDRPVPDVVEHLVGLQAQTPHSWYVGLWSRIAGFQPDIAVDLITGRALVRVALMRSTIHLVTASDAWRLRPLLQPVLDRDLFTNHIHGRGIRGMDIAALVDAGRELLTQPRTPRALGALLHERWPDRPANTLAYAVRNQLPLVQVPPRGLWGRSGPIAHVSAESWLGGERPAGATLADAVRRYLGAFGPATVKDVQTWSGLTRLREIVDGMDLVAIRGEDGSELFDLPDAPRPDPDTPAPPRFLYDFDNLMLSYADRSRVITDEFKRLSVRPHGPVPEAVLVDGVTAGEWTLGRAGGVATLTVRTYRPLPAVTADAVEAEAAGLLGFLAPDAEVRDVELHVVEE